MIFITIMYVHLHRVNIYNAPDIFLIWGYSKDNSKGILKTSLLSKVTVKMIFTGLT